MVPINHLWLYIKDVLAQLASKEKTPQFWNAIKATYSS
jgi:hypothetical protein